MGPIPPGIFGYREGEAGINPVVYDWVDGRPVRKPIEVAKKLLAEAGYPDGRDAKTGQPLVLYLDTVQRGPGDKPRLDWYRRQFAEARHPARAAHDATGTGSRRRSAQGNTQLFFLGWNADYPDPENFMFLLHGPQARAKTGGENTANYAEPGIRPPLRADEEHAERPGARRRSSTACSKIAREDAPWVWGYHPKDYGLAHAWVKNVKPNQMARNGLKYLSRRRGDARSEARRVEPPRPVADLGRADRARAERGPGRALATAGASAMAAQAGRRARA